MFMYSNSDFLIILNFLNMTRIISTLRNYKKSLSIFEIIINTCLTLFWLAKDDIDATC